MDALRTAATRIGAVVALGLVAVLLSVTSPPPALADAGLEQQFVAAINAERADAGLAALAPAGDLTTAARRHAQTMATTDHLHHNPNLGSAVGGWRKIGENVGRGPEVRAIHQAFMDSPGHRRNVLDPAFTEVGIGVIVHDGQIWVTEMFRQPTTSVTVDDPEGGTTDTHPGADESSLPTDDLPTDHRTDADAVAGVAPLQHDRMMLVQMRVAAHDQALVTTPDI